MASTSGSEFVVNSAAETSQNVDLVFVDEDEMPLTSVAIGTAYLERESDEEIDSDFYQTDSEAEESDENEELQQAGPPRKRRHGRGSDWKHGVLGRSGLRALDLKGLNLVALKKCNCANCISSLMLLKWPTVLPPISARLKQWRCLLFFRDGEIRLVPIETCHDTKNGVLRRCAIYEVRQDDSRGNQIQNSIFWMDSTCNRYVENHEKRYETFVANRVSGIHEYSLPSIQFAKIAKFQQFVSVINLKSIGPDCYYTSRENVFPVIDTYWQTEQTRVFNSIKDRGEPVALVDNGTVTLQVTMLSMGLTMLDV
ncbi:hypothetical protein AWC38_SpisGene1985 [Stylophora pistillata]|uniref:Uncharacterized protein n=1 Tax=Stylophora pistillata TaxID=50429 RepID=A0A2B4SXM2_STYPI|nr:hypothetical protein AWC38_SpisGene1985 [Stylophora pistillata]